MTPFRKFWEQLVLALVVVFATILLTALYLAIFALMRYIGMYRA
jgi:hypothetical protein